MRCRVRKHPEPKQTPTRVLAAALALCLLIIASFQICEAKGGSEKLTGDLKTAIHQLHRRHPDRALELLQNTLSKQPNNIPSLLVKAEALLLMERLDQALSAVNTVLKESPKNCSALVLRSHINFRRGNFKDAGTDASAAIKSESTLWRCLSRSC